MCLLERSLYRAQISTNTTIALKRSQLIIQFPVKIACGKKKSNGTANCHLYLSGNCKPRSNVTFQIELLFFDGCLNLLQEYVLLHYGEVFVKIVNLIFNKTERLDMIIAIHEHILIENLLTRNKGCYRIPLLFLRHDGNTLLLL